MFCRYVTLGTCCLLTVALIVVSVGNLQEVGILILGKEFQFPVGFILAGALISGLLTGLATVQVMSHHVVHDKHKLEWEAQDAKLIASVKSDREKLLESKIATLETALKQALKKG